MATPHIKANPGDIAEKVLLPGDPLRAKFIAENFLEDAVRYNEVRGMYGYTGTYKGKRVSIQGTGMGVPSISIYTHELITHFGCKRLMRIGSCGSFQPEVKLMDVKLDEILKKQPLYSGKAKSIYEIDDDTVLIEFRDDITAGNGAKHDVKENKGYLNALISSKLFEVLEKNGVETHYVKYIEPRYMIAKKVEIVPVGYS